MAATERSGKVNRMSHPVKHYFASWDLDDHKGTIVLVGDGGATLNSFSITSSTEFSVIIDLLRREGPLSLHTGLQLLETGLEPVGVAELT